jgi:formylglycine-generating enzyme required for sulfatase activity
MLIAAVVCVAGCGTTSTMGEEDSGVDARAVEPDAPPIADAAVDDDMDGVPGALDCDDGDAAVGRTSMRSCASACAMGVERCTDGVWGACDAPTDCTCATPGMMRSVPCGRCGLASQVCQADMTWSTPGTCLGESECFDGEVETETVRCGERSRICDSTCHWRDWTEITPPGECDAGATVIATSDACPPFETRDLICSASCMWEETRACSSICTRPPRPSLSGADPVCIPAGPFVLGGGSGASSPERMVILSEFYVDRYPVTRARYEMCRAAAACPPAAAAYAAAYAALAPETYPAWLPIGAGPAFCTWDGGTLVTEFQWEKAARGPHPDRRMHSWGVEPADPCRAHPAPGCSTLEFAITPTQFPDAISPYGVRMLGSLPERTSTPYLSGYAWIADGATDPAPSSMPAARTVRGTDWYSFMTYRPVGDSAVRRLGTTGDGQLGFRCAY